MLMKNIAIFIERMKSTQLKKNYQKNISDIIYMRHGDIYALDSGLNRKREQIKVPSKNLLQIHTV